MKAYSIKYDPIRLNVDNNFRCISQMIYGLGYLKEKISAEINENDRLAYKVADESSDFQTEPDVHFSIFNSVSNNLDEHLILFESDFEYLYCNAIFIMSFSYFENSLRKILKEKFSNYHSKWKIETLINKTGRKPTFEYDSLELVRNQLCHNNMGTTYEKHKEQLEKYISTHTNEFSWIDEILVINKIDYCNSILNEFYNYLCEVCDAFGYKHIENEVL